MYAQEQWRRSGVKVDTGIVVGGSSTCESMRFGRECFTATRWASNHDWCYRGDNTKYKEKC